MEDIHAYNDVNAQHFMFEITPKTSPKAKGGNVINLLVKDNAEDISKAFDAFSPEHRNKNCKNLFLNCL